MSVAATPEALVFDCAAGTEPFDPLAAFLVLAVTLAAATLAAGALFLDLVGDGAVTAFGALGVGVAVHCHAPYASTHA